MRVHSVYVIDCVCGARIESEHPLGACACGLGFEVRNWGKYQQPPTTNQGAAKPNAGGSAPGAPAAGGVA